MVRIVFTGTHCTGKTTLIQRVVPRIQEKYGFSPSTVSEVARIILRRGLPIHTQSTGETYVAMLEAHVNLELKAQQSIVLLDRFVLDYAAYAIIHGNCHQDILNLMKHSHFLLRKSLGYSHVFYLPIEFPAEADGERNTDEDYRREVDEMILRLLKNWDQPYHTIRGTMEARIREVMRVIPSSQTFRYLSEDPY